MTLECESELRSANESITRLYRLRDRLSEETTGSKELREDEFAGVNAMIRKIERQISDHTTTRPEPKPSAA